MNKIHIIENFVDQKDLGTILEYLNTTEVTFDPTGYSPFGVYMQNQNNSNLKEVFEKNSLKAKNIIEKSFNCEVYEEGMTSVVELKAGDFMPLHFDHGSSENESVGLKTGAGNPSRDISSVLYYNDDYEGGEIYFPNQDLLIKPNPGMFIYFPAKDEFPHQVKEIKSGYRWCSTAFWCIKKD
jgi:hypothetical protein